MSAVAETALGLVGETPLVRVGGFDTGPCELWLKLESQNPHVLEAVLGGGAALDRPATDAMASRFGTVSPRTPLRQLVPLLEASDVAIVAEGVELLGVVTRLDVLEHLRAARS